ncbi:MAG TPA: tetratricopeptide repeat protein, partial [Polyangiaceae bacterium]
SAAAGGWSKMFGDAEPQPAPSVPSGVAPAPLAKPAPQIAVAPQVQNGEQAPERAEPETRQPTTLASAATLLADASNARRAGDVERAIALYRRLEREFPSSPEAGLAALPLGGLLLDRGEARSALAQFDRHVRSGRGSRLLPEALYGRGRSLAALGNRSEERRTWTTLLEQFPESPYAGHARRRLAELGRTD